MATRVIQYGQDKSGFGDIEKIRKVTLSFQCTFIFSCLDREYFKCDSSDPFNNFGFGYLGQNLSLDEVKAKMSCLQVMANWN